MMTIINCLLIPKFTVVLCDVACYNSGWGYYIVNIVCIQYTTNGYICRDLV